MCAPGSLRNLDRKADKSHLHCPPTRQHQSCAFAAAFRTSRRSSEHVAGRVRTKADDERGQSDRDAGVAARRVAIEPYPTRRLAQLPERRDRARRRAVARLGGLVTGIAATGHLVKLLPTVLVLDWQPSHHFRPGRRCDDDGRIGDLDRVDAGVEVIEAFCRFHVGRNLRRIGD